MKMLLTPSEPSGPEGKGTAALNFVTEVATLAPGGPPSTSKSLGFSVKGQESCGGPE